MRALRADRTFRWIFYAVLVLLRIPAVLFILIASAFGTVVVYVLVIIRLLYTWGDHDPMSLT